MKERIGQIARGQIKYEKPKLLLDPECIQETLAAGFTYRRDFHLFSTNRVPVRGLVYSNQKQVMVDQEQFAGSRCYLKYSVNTAGLRPGTELKGAFHFVTNGREFELPYCFAIGAADGGETLVESLDELYQLFLRDEKQALQVFSSPGFAELPFMEELHGYALYESLLRGGGTGSALSSFLKGMGYPVEEPADAAGPGETQEVSRAKPRYSSLAGLQGREHYRHLMDLLLEYQCGKYPPERLLPELEKEAVRLCKVYPDQTLPVLMRAFLALEGGYRSAASKLLEDAYHTVIDRRRSETVNYCFYLFLRSRVGVPEEQKENIVKLLDKYYQELNYPLGLLFLVLYVDAERSRDIVSVLRLLKDAYHRGIYSPFLYAEAMKWYALRPELLTSLDAFEWECFRFSAEYGTPKSIPKKALRHGGSRVLKQASYGKIQITEELAGKIAGLAAAERGYSRENVELLIKLYEMYPLEDLLRAILVKLLLGGQRSPEWFPWYQKGIQQGLQFMGLYEAYLASMPADYNGTLPRELVIFYSFHNELPEELKEVLYANVLRCYPVETQEYEDYREQMEQFAIARLLKGKISPYLAPIYQHVIHQEMVDERLSTVLPDLIFAKRIRCPKEDMVRLLVRYPEFGQEMGYAITGGCEVCCPVYTEDALLLFVDPKGGRHVYPETTVEPLMEDHGLIDRCRQWNRLDPMLNLLSCRDAMARTAPAEGDWALLSAASVDAQLHARYRGQIIAHILKYWQAFCSEPEAEEFLLQLDEASMSRADRARYIEVLVSEKHMERAFQVVERWGYTGVGSQVLSDLLAGVLRRDSESYRPVLLELALSLYRRDRADAAVMAYICRFFNGSTLQMCQILNATVELRGQVQDLPERLLAQMLFTEETEGLDQVFYIYSAQERMYHELAQAYFVWKSYRSLAAGEALPEYFSEYLERYYREASFREEGCILTAAQLLELLTQKPDKADRALMQELTDLLCENGRYFAFYQELPKEIVLPDSLNGCMILEYRSDQPGEYFVQYDRYPGNVNSGSLPLHPMCQGVYGEPVMLFDGETLSVTYFRRYQGQEELLRSGQQVCYRQCYTIPGSLYQQLNQVCSLLKEDRPETREAAEKLLFSLKIKEEMLARIVSGEQEGGAET